LRRVARHGTGGVGHEGRHALLRTDSVRVAARNTEHEAIEVIRARAGDAPAESLVGAREEAGESVRAIGARLAGDPAIHTHIVLARKARKAIVGIVTTRIGAQTASNTLVALVGRVAAIGIVVAGAAARDEAALDIIATRGQTDFAAGGNADLTDGTGHVGVIAQCVLVWTCRATTEGCSGAPRAAPHGPTNSANAAVSSHAP
jgi:hypothetical protein